MKLYAIPIFLIITVDVLEYNTLISDRGYFVLDQYILWDFDQNKGDYVINDYKLARLTDGKIYQQINIGKQFFIPLPDIVKWEIYYDGFYHLYTTNKNGKLVHVRAKVLKISETQFDPEIRNRTILPEKERKQSLNREN